MELPIRTNRHLAQAVQNAELPSMSSIAAKLVATLNQEPVDIGYLRDLIAQDPSMSTAMLRWANSPIYGAARKIGTLDAAISILGLSRVRARAIAFYISNAIAPPLNIDRADFLATCMRNADSAQWLAPLAGVDANEAWLTAMMVRLGELVIGTIDPPTLAQVEAMKPVVSERWQLERNKFGFDEGDVMAELARLWFFPDPMIDALHKCANPLGYMEFSPMAAVIHLAMLLADSPPVEEAHISALPPPVLAALGLTTEALLQHLHQQPLQFDDYR